ncbi:MAG: hypothetical protein NVS2B12_34210 [Ktedonobacteraceae bacterium]
MAEMQNHNHSISSEGSADDLERQLLEGVTLTPREPASYRAATPPLPPSHTDEDGEVSPAHDVQGALGYFAEASQDMATAGLELGLGRHFACVDFCNQAVEKAAQAVSLLRVGHRTMYDHDLRTLGEKVGAPQEIQDEMARLTPFHPETFYADTPPEEADEIISAEQANGYIQSARKVLRWARIIVLSV